MNIFFTLILTVVSLLFSILSHNLKNRSFFYIGVVALALITLFFARNITYTLHALRSGNVLYLVMIASYITSIVFLVLHLTRESTSSSNNNDVTDAFLDEIIEGDDEEWDAES